MSSSSDPTATLAQQALERAKAIAAKLSGTVPGAQTTAASTKRRRWDEPTGGNSETADDDQSKRIRTAGSTSAAGASSSDNGVAATRHEKRIWITTTDERPAQHYVLHLADQLKALNESNGLESDVADSVSAKLLGKGTDEAVVPGWPQLPLHILLTTPSHQQLTAVAAQIQEWIDQADREPALNYSELSLAMRPENGDAGSSGYYRPASVAQLIHGNPSSSHDAPFSHETTIGVPHSVVGYIIGRGGSTLAQLQASTGVSVQIQKETELEPGQTQRLITLSAHDEQSLKEGQRQIEKLVREKCGPTAGAPGLGFTKKHLYDAKLDEAIAAGHAHLTLHVPEDDVGLVIGKQGSTIRQIQDSTGCNVQVMPPDNDSRNDSSKEGDDAKDAKTPPTRAVHVTHPTEQGAQSAKVMIEDILKSKPRYSGGHYGGSNIVTVQVAVPDGDVGLCIGKQGSVIRQIQNSTNCRIQIPPQCGPGETHRIVSVSGSQEGTETVRRIFETISAEQSSACVMSGNFNQYQSRQVQGQYYNQQQQHQQQQQQHDPNQQYSAEWAAYHAAQATVQQQQHSQQQTPPQQAEQYVATPSESTTPAANAYYEEFFRYAYYYGEDAARQYYGAWSPPPSTPNPYGVNPALSVPPASNRDTVAAASALNTAPTEAVPASEGAAGIQTSISAAAAESAVRDSSRRKVSNLPAWMTKS